MKSYIYHSPEGDRQAFAKDSPKNGLIDLFDKGGNLDIGSCRIGGEEGQCEPADSVVIDVETSVSDGELSKDEIKALLDEKGIEYDARWGLAKLKEALESE